MNSALLGIASLVGGGVLLVIGFQERDSFASDVSDVIHGTPTDRSMWFLGIGAVLAVVGIALIFRGRRSLGAKGS